MKMENNICGEECGDNRFEVIEKAKNHLIESTNISSSQDEMKVLDSFLFRCWQMGWLKKYDDNSIVQGEFVVDKINLNERSVDLFVYAESLFDMLITNDWYEGNKEEADSDMRRQMDRIRKVIGIIKKYDDNFPMNWFTSSDDIQKKFPDGLTEKTLEYVFDERYWKDI